MHTTGYHPSEEPDDPLLHALRSHEELHFPSGLSPHLKRKDHVHELTRGSAYTRSDGGRTHLIVVGSSDKYDRPLLGNVECASGPNLAEEDGDCRPP